MLFGFLSTLKVYASKNDRGENILGRIRHNRRRRGITQLWQEGVRKDINSILFVADSKRF